MSPPPWRTLLLHIQAPAVAAADRGGLESSCGLTCQCLPPGSRRPLSSHPGLSPPAEAARPCSWDLAEQQPPSPRRLLPGPALPPQPQTGQAGLGPDPTQVGPSQSAGGPPRPPRPQSPPDSPAHGTWLPTGGWILQAGQPGPHPSPLPRPPGRRQLEPQPCPPGPSVRSSNGGASQPARVCSGHPSTAT